MMPSSIHPHTYINAQMLNVLMTNPKQVYLLEELTPGRELFLLLQRVGRLQEWEAAFYAGGVLLAYVHKAPSHHFLVFLLLCYGRYSLVSILA